MVTGRGGAARPLAASDAVAIPDATEHGHGTTATERLEHVVITEYAGDDCVVWLDPADVETYSALPAAR